MTSSSDGEPLIAAALVGTWHLETFVVSFSDGAPNVYPFGEQARGQIVYAADGHMSAALCRADRGPLGVAGLESSRRAEATDKASAFDSYLSYAGRWSLDGEEVTHHVAFALVPEVVGQRQVRRARWVDDALELSYERPTRRGATARYCLRWVRPSAP